MVCAMRMLLIGLGLISMSNSLVLNHANRHDPVTEENHHCSPVNALPAAKYVSPQEFIKDPAAYMVIGKKPLPPQLRGLFWLTNMSNGPALMSFGGPISSTPSDGCSSGKLDKHGKYCLREAGEGTFMSASKDNFLYAFARTCDKHLLYQFDSPTNPSNAEMSVGIGDCPRLRGVCEHLTNMDEAGVLSLDPEFMLDMSLIDCVEHKHHLYGNEYPNSFCWGRRNWQGKKEDRPDYLTYIMVQVVNEHGEKLEPAWSNFVLEQSNPLLTGFPPGLLVYHDVPRDRQ